MIFEKIRPWLLRIGSYLRRTRPLLKYGKGCRFERSSTLRLGKV